MPLLINSFYRLCLFIIVKSLFISTQIVQRNNSDLFSLISSYGPIFDQVVYMARISVASPFGTNVFKFSLEPQNEQTIPSYLTYGRALNSIADIGITWTEPAFSIRKLTNFTYQVLTNTNQLNYFSRYHRYQFNITATQFIPGRASVSSTAIAQIDLSYCNMYAPTFITSSFTFYIASSLSVGIPFGTVFATDSDKDPIVFALVSATSQFAIDRFTGVLTLTQTFQTVTSSNISLVINATDVPSCSYLLSGLTCCAARSSVVPITVIITTANTEAPRFINQLCSSNFSLPETSPVNTTIVTLTAVDNDLGDSGRIVFSFPSDLQQTNFIPTANNNPSVSTFYSKFALYQYPQNNNSRYVQLRTSDVFDYDQGGSPRVWNLFILASDLGRPPLQSLCTIRISLTEVNEYSPVFIATFWNQTIYSTTGPTIMRVVAYDLDYGLSGVVNYYIGSITQGYFTLDSSTGIISFAPGVTFSNVNSALFPLTFTVFAQDSGTPPKMSTANATIQIYLSVNNTQPAVQWLNPSSGQISVTISEKYFERFFGIPIFDNQANFNGSIIYQSNTQSYYFLYVSNPFSVASIPFREATAVVNNFVFTSGILVTNGLDCEVQAQYLLSLRVTSNPSLLGWASVSLRDENDNAPQFTVPSLQLNIPANQVGTRTIGQFIAYDRDLTSPNNLVQYRINTQLTDSVSLSLFTLLPDGTLITSATFSLQNQSTYLVTITAYDGALAWGSTTSNTQDFQLYIYIIGSSNYVPVFNSTAMTLSVDESTAVGTSIMNVTVTDGDLYSILTFGILDGNSKNIFSFTMFSDNSGDLLRTQYIAIVQLVLVGPLEYADQQTYSLVLYAFDRSNLVTLSVFVNVTSSKPYAPFFIFQPGPLLFEYQIYELSSTGRLNGNPILVNDSNPLMSSFQFSIISTNQQILQTIYLNQSNNQVVIGIAPPGLTRDLPYGRPTYNFGLCVTNQNGLGVSSYAPVQIDLIDVNNNAPVPTSQGSPWIIPEAVANQTVSIIIIDFDDITLNNTVPFTVQVVDPPSFQISPRLSRTNNFTLRCNGTLSRADAKNISVTIMATDMKGLSANTSIPIIVGDVRDNNPISDGYKTINVVYPIGYEYSIVNVNLGSVYVVNTDDWFLADNQYAIKSLTQNSAFQINYGFLRASSTLSSGSYTIVTQVTKTLSSGQPSTATSSINLVASNINLDSIREAATVRIQGETPESLVDLSFGNRLDGLRQALATVLSVSSSSILILTIRPVPQYRNPTYAPLTFDVAKQTALTDIIFSVSSSTRQAVENTIYNNLARLSSLSGLTINSTGPNPCRNYGCLPGTFCITSRSIQPFPRLVDTNLTSFAGINILDSADCINSTWRAYPQSPLPTGCTILPYNDAVSCPCSNVQSLAPLGGYCAVLGLTFFDSGSSYAVFDGSTFSNVAPARFSFEFIVPNASYYGLLLLYGKENPPIDDFLWVAVELVASGRVRFHMRNRPYFDTNLVISASTWYHVEYQYLSDTILFMVNNEQYDVTVYNNTISTNQSSVRLYIGGLPQLVSPVAALYPSLTSIDTFRGCIRNVRSGGVDLDMNRPLYASDNSEAGQCDCTMSNTCSVDLSKAATGVIVPWFVWLIIGLVFVFLLTIVLISYVLFSRRVKQQKVTRAATFDNVDSITEPEHNYYYRDTTGEQDNVSYDLAVLKKPVYTISNEEIWNEILHTNKQDYRYDPTVQASLGNFIDLRLREQCLIPPQTRYDNII